eukprot:365865-Chlamydomonas_euryale.AAC.13
MTPATLSETVAIPRVDERASEQHAQCADAYLVEHIRDLGKESDSMARGARMGERGHSLAAPSSDGGQMT